MGEVEEPPSMKPPGRRRRLPLAAAALATATALGAGALVATLIPSASATPASTAVARAAADDAVQRGVYVGPADPAGVAAFNAATGTHATIATDFLPQSSGWSGMDGAGGSLSWLFPGHWSGSGYTLSLGVPMIPEQENAQGQYPALGTLAQGATGAYNGYFVTLAQTLVAAGEANAYLRLGWEFDGGNYAWSATDPADEASYATYFQQIVNAMRSVPGERFKFVWDPDASAFNDGPYNVALAYPGNAYVTDIGVDAYDQSWTTPLTPGNAWSETLLPDLNAAEQFAAAQGKPLAVPEWGVTIRTDGHGLGDDPLFVNNITAWMMTPANNVAYESYFDYNAGGIDSAITNGSFPNSLQAFSFDLNPLRGLILLPSVR
jgi:hypothetical protein